MKRLALAAILVTPALLSASAISSVSNCYVPGAASSGSTSCSTSVDLPFDANDILELHSGPQVSRGNASGSYSIVGNTLQVDLVASAQATVDASAFSTVSFHDQLTTDGPVRAGFIKGVYLPGDSHYGGLGSSMLTYPGKLYDTFGPMAPPMPFTLGQSFILDASVFAGSRSDDYTPSFWFEGVQLQLSFFEADGVTPVKLAETPEPSTLALIGLPVIAVLVRSRRPLLNP